MTYSINNNYQLRTPLLPLKRINSNITAKTIEIFDLLNINSEEAQNKYLKRISYRTIPFKGLANIGRCSFKKTYNQFKINDLNICISSSWIEELINYLISKNLITDYLIQKSFLIEKSDDYLIFKSDQNHFAIKYNKLIHELISMLEKPINKIEVIKKLSKNNNNVNNLINDLEMNGFIMNELYDIIEINKIIDCNFIKNKVSEIINLLNMKEYKSAIELSKFFKFSSDLLKITRYSNEESSLNIDKNFFLNVPKILNILLGTLKLKGYDIARDYFLENYGDSLVPFKKIFDDKIFLSKLFSIKYSIDKNSPFLQLIKQDLFLNKFKSLNYSYKDLNKSLSLQNQNLQNNFDLFVNLLNIDGTNILNIDNEHEITRGGNATKNISKNTSINFISNIQGLADLQANMDKSFLDINKINNKTSSKDNLYVGINNDFFYFFDKNKNEIVDFQKYSMILDEFFDEEIRMLFSLSHKDNLKRFIDLGKVFKDYLYIPRIKIDNMIIAREQWKISLSALSKNNINKLNNYINFLYDYYNLKPNICYIEDDIEILLNLNDKDDLLFLLKKINKYGQIYLKEDLQKYSFLYIKGKQYSNELILNFQRYLSLFKEQTTKTFMPEYHHYKPLEKWMYFQIKLFNFEINCFKFLKIIKNHCSSKNQIFYYLFYKDLFGEETIRIRIKECRNLYRLLKILNNVSFVKNFEILSYKPEYARYSQIGITNFEEISHVMSKRIIESYYKLNLTNKLNLKKEIIKNIIIFFNSLNIPLLEQLQIIKPYRNGKEDREKMSDYSKLITRSFEEADYIFKDIKIIMKHKQINHSEILSILHLNNNRLIRTNLSLEKEIMNYLYLFLNKKNQRLKYVK